VLEDAGPPRLPREGPQRGQALAGVDDDHLAGLDLADEGGADEVERAGLAGHHPGGPAPTQHQRAEAVWIAHRDQGGLGGQQQRARPRRDLVHEAQQVVWIGVFVFLICAQAAAARWRRLAGQAGRILTMQIRSL